MKRNLHSIVQAFLILALASVAVAWHLAKPGVPGPESSDGAIITPSTAVATTAYANLGKKQLFTTILPKAPPAIADVMAEWTLTEIAGGNKATLVNRRTKQRLELRPGETRTVTRGGDALAVTLARLDPQKGAATLQAPGIEDPDRRQEYVLWMSFAPIAKVLSDWTVTVLLSPAKAGFTDRRTRRYFEMNVGATQTVTRGKDTLTVTLASLDLSKAAATFSAPGAKGATQKWTLSMP